MRRFALLPLLLVALTGCARLDPNAVYFLVSEQKTFHGDSFIVPLTDPDHIAHARALIDNPENAGSPIVVAAIERCTACDGINRDLLNDGNYWSWCVTAVDGFADVSAEIYDGWPTYVEENLDAWFDTTQGNIAFWSYTVTRELTSREVLSGQLDQKMNSGHSAQSGSERTQ
ncbi:MAG: hypothetical protein SGI88_13560 [Candidatus Hydrogenedentes bacterium]|nr:hypothetical protein [Candidatus Hydrogenedentota bacterium]